MPSFANTTGVPSCAAGYEYAAGGGGACVKTDVCRDGPCFPGVLCVPLPPPAGGFACGEDPGSPCPPGYEGDGVECLDVDECAGSATGCSPRATCKNIPGDYLCECDDGYRGVGRGPLGCAFSGPCSSSNGGCWEHPSLPGVRSECTTTGARTSCGPCPAGYEGDPEGECVEVDGCALAAAGACSGGAVCVDAPPPSTGHACECPDGMEYDYEAGLCVDIIDPCDDPACFEDDALGVSVECIQLAPGLGAVCGPCPAEAGLKGDGTVCVPLSPCAANPCFVGANGAAATCTDAAAPADGYVCGPCPRGYEADGEGSCRDVDECAEGGAGLAACGPRAACANVAGGFNCTALPRDPSTTSCDDGNGGCDPLVGCCEGVFGEAGECVREP